MATPVHDRRIECIVADRGATVHVVSREMADWLAAAGLVAPFTPATGQRSEIVFGKASAREPVIGAFSGSGPRPVIVDVQVVEEASCGLISDILLTRQGFVVINADTHLLVIRRVDNGWVPVLTARRDPHAAAGSSESLWVYNPEQLFSAQVPVEVSEDASIGLDIAVGDNSATELADVGSESTTTSLLRMAAQLFVGGAKPTYSAEHVKLARAWLKNWGNGSARSKALTIEHGALLDVPDYLTPALLRHIAAKNDNPLYAMCKRRIPSCGGSGVHCVEIGKRVSFDDIGKFRASTWGATYVTLFMDVASRYVVAYAMSEKTTMKDALILYQEQATSYGHKVTEAQADATSTIGADFLTTAQARGLQIVQSAAEDQRTNPVEATWRTLKRNVALLCISQDNFDESDWVLAVIRAVTDHNTTVHEGATKTPLELYTAHIPSLAHIAAFPYGALVTTPRMGVLAIGTSPFELGLHVTAIVTGPKSHAIVLLEQGKSAPQVRAHCELVESTSPPLTHAQIEALAPDVDERGNVTRYRAVRTEPLTMQGLVERFEQQTMPPALPTGDPLRRDHPGEQQERDRVQGRLTSGGTFSNKNRLQASGKRLRSASGADAVMDELMARYKENAAALMPQPAPLQLADADPLPPPEQPPDVPPAVLLGEDPDDGFVEQYWTGAVRTDSPLPVSLSVDGLTPLLSPPFLQLPHADASLPHRPPP